MGLTILGELCKYGFNSSGKVGIPTQANKQTMIPELPEYNNITNWMHSKGLRTNRMTYKEMKQKLMFIATFTREIQYVQERTGFPIPSKSTSGGTTSFTSTKTGTIDKAMQAILRTAEVDSQKGKLIILNPLNTEDGREIQKSREKKGREKKKSGGKK